MVSKFEEQKNKFGICVKCNNLRTDFNWCSSCDCAQLIKNFNNWTSGNDELDKFIQYTQSTAKSYLSYLEWIPYERFENIKLISVGELSYVYSAVWKDGERINNYWDDGENSHIHERSQPIPVALKRHCATGVIIKILTRHHVVCMNNATRKSIQHYGITKDPVTGEFVLVMQYANDGSLKDFLFKNKIKHDWQWKLNIFRYLAQDLSTIHNAGLTHQDVEDENVYIRDDWAYISQLYWSVSKEEMKGEKEFKKRKASDIYGFGGVMRQIAIDSNRYYNLHDETKTKDIPSPVLKLIKSCLDDNFRKRPDINKILYILEKWCGNPQHNQFESF